MVLIDISLISIGSISQSINTDAISEPLVALVITVLVEILRRK